MAVVVVVAVAVAVAVSVGQTDGGVASHIVKGCACTWAGVAISQSISNANNSIAKQSTSAVPVETILDRFSFVFIFYLLKS